MRVLICGAGRVGQGIARRLAQEKHDVTIVDADSELVDRVSTELDVRGLAGHAAHPDVLKNAGAADAEMIIAVTYYDEINMVICQIAHTLFAVPTKIARVRAQAYLDPSWKNLFSREGLPIDVVISPEIAVGDAILQRFLTPGAVMSATFGKGKVQVLGLEIGDQSPLVETALDQVADLFPDLSARVIGIGRGDVIHAPRSNDRLSVGDRAYVAVNQTHISRVTEIFSPDQKELKHVVIVGGGNVGVYVAEMLEKRSSLRVRLIELDPDQAEKAVRRLKRTIVISGDGLDPNILEEAGAANADFVISITDDDKTNLLISSLSKRIGAARTLALVNSVELAALSREMSVDAVLDPRALTVSQILLRMRRGRILSLQSLEDGAAEIAEGVILDASPLKGEHLGYDDLPEGITAAAIVRGDEVIFPKQDTVVRTDDRVIVFFEKNQTRKVEQFFRVSPDFF